MASICRRTGLVFAFLLLQVLIFDLVESKATADYYEDEYYDQLDDYETEEEHDSTYDGNGLWCRRFNASQELCQEGYWNRDACDESCQQPPAREEDDDDQEQRNLGLCIEKNPSKGCSENGYGGTFDCDEEPQYDYLTCYCCTQADEKYDSISEV